MISHLPVVKAEFGNGTFSITYSPSPFMSPLRSSGSVTSYCVPILQGTPPRYPNNARALTAGMEVYDSTDPMNIISDLQQKTNDQEPWLCYFTSESNHPNGWRTFARYCMYSIVANEETRKIFSFLPWKRVTVDATPGIDWPYGMQEVGTTFYVLDTSGISVNFGSFEQISPGYAGTDFPDAITYGRDITYTWTNIPDILISPIASIVITVEGVGLETQIYPINKTSVDGSSIITTVPIIECYNPLASDFAGLHDEMIISRDVFETAANFKLDPTARGERTLRFRAQYVLKDGTLHQLYIPPNGVFSLQLTYGIYY